MTIKWRDIRIEQPDDNQFCLTKMKHGIIQGRYDAEEESFVAYYWRSMSWYATHWVPMTEINEPSAP